MANATKLAFPIFRIPFDYRAAAIILPLKTIFAHVDPHIAAATN